VSIEFEDYSVEVKSALTDKARQFLEEVGSELMSQTQRNSRRDTSQTAGSYQFKVQNDSVYIGSDFENAIWEEFGTGVHALHGDGRKTAWWYKDRHGQWHKTKGKTANRPLYKSFTASKARIIRQAQNLFGGM